jgi:hypothetical protein
MKYKIPILISYWMFLNDKKGNLLQYLEKNNDRFSLIVDSGAFSAFTQQKKINVDDYCNWIHEVLNPISKKIKVDGYFQLDVICDQKATKTNLVISEKRGTTPIPVFTRAENLDDLVYMSELQRKYKWIGVGAIKGTAKQYVKWLLDNCKDCTKLHLLGFADINFILHYKPKSFDYSTWYNGGLYGDFYNPKTMRRVKHGGRLSLKEATDLGFQEKDYEFINNPEYRSYKGLLMNAPQASACNAFIQQSMRMQRIGITPYMVVINAQQLEVLKRSYDYFIDRNPIDLFTK